MKFALVYGKRQEAQPNLSGKCLACGHPMIAKCGEIKIWHWAHKSRRHCDHWWENETEWHRTWKGNFPVDWQEVVNRDKNGEKHIADVETDQGWVLEFQHSYLKPEERRARDAFYQKLVWVVDGTRRKRDKLQFSKALKKGINLSAKLPILCVHTEGCALLREWAGCRAPVFFDFSGVNDSEGGPLWWLLPWSLNGMACVLQFSRPDFIKLHRTGSKQEGLDILDILKQLKEIVSRDISSDISRRRAHRRAQALNQLARQSHYRRSRRPESFRQYLARKRQRRRF
jgi:hypothetical protein